MTAKKIGVAKGRFVCAGVMLWDVNAEALKCADHANHSKNSISCVKIGNKFETLPQPPGADVPPRPQ